MILHSITDSGLPHRRPGRDLEAILMSEPQWLPEDYGEDHEYPAEDVAAIADEAFRKFFQNVPIPDVKLARIIHERDIATGRAQLPETD